MQYVGLDVHKKDIHATVLDEQGNKVLESKFRTNSYDIADFIGKIDKNSKVVVEACSCWQHPFDFFENFGFDICLAHPLKTRAIADARIKTDSRDSETLAHLLRTNLIPKSYVPPMYVRMEREIVRHRASLVGIRTQIKNKVHAILIKNGIEYEFSDLFGKAGMEFLRALDLPEVNRFELDQYLMLLKVLDHKIHETSQQIDAVAEENPQAMLLTTIPGISYYSALLIMAEIGDVNRFDNAEQLCSYAGLVPSTHQSGNTTYHGKITKQGSKWMRWILIQAVQKTVKQPNGLQRFYQRLEKRKGGKIATVAAARKLLHYIYAMLKNGIPFDALQINKG